MDDDWWLFLTTNTIRDTNDIMLIHIQSIYSFCGKNVTCDVVLPETTYPLLNILDIYCLLCGSDERRYGEKGIRSCEIDMFHDITRSVIRDIALVGTRVIRSRPGISLYFFSITSYIRIVDGVSCLCLAQNSIRIVLAHTGVVKINSNSLLHSSCGISYSKS
jgi:hypothetical protein